MKLEFEFVLHWLFCITFAVLTISGLAMIGARFGWILNYDITTADLVHRVFAVPFVLITFLALGQEFVRVLKGRDDNGLIWGIFWKKGYGFFTLLTTLIFIITGIILWKSHHTNQAALAFSMFVHENLTYIVLAGLVWHIYQKAHALLWPKQVIPENIMMQPWFKIVIWFIASAFFFAVAAVMISFGQPEPSKTQVDAFMTGMMQAMMNSIMGIAAMDSSEQKGFLELMLAMFSSLVLVALLMSAYFVWKRAKANE